MWSSVRRNHYPLDMEPWVFACAHEGCSGQVTYEGRMTVVGALRKRASDPSAPFRIFLRCDAPDGHVSSYVIAPLEPT